MNEAKAQAKRRFEKWVNEHATLDIERSVLVIAPEDVPQFEIMLAEAGGDGRGHFQVEFPSPPARQ